MRGGKEYYYSPRLYFFLWYGATSPLTVTLNPLYIAINILLQIKIGISDTSCQRLAARALRHRPPPGCDALRHGLMDVTGRDQAATATFKATRPPRPVASHLTGSRREPEKKGRTPTFYVALMSSQVDKRRVTRCQKWWLAGGRRAPAIWASSDVWYHGWVNVSPQQGHQPAPTRSIIQLGFLSCRPGWPNRWFYSGLTGSVFRSTRPWHCFYVRNRNVDRERKPQTCFKSIRQGRPWGGKLARVVLGGGQAFSFSLSQYVFRCVCKCVVSVCIQSRSGQCRLGWYLFMTSSHHACPLETDGYEPKINAFIVFCWNGSCSSGSERLWTCLYYPTLLHYKRAWQV